MSPDGSQLAYVSEQSVSRSLSEFDALQIPGTESDGTISSPTFSPDGHSIAFHSQTGRAIRRVAVSGGASMTLCPAIPPFGMAWDSSGIVAGQGAGGVIRCSPGGAPSPERLAAVDDGELAHGPQLLLDGAALLFTIAKAADGPIRWDKARIVVQTLKSGVRKTVVNGGTDARYLPTGHLVYGFGGIVFAVGFDPARQEVIGDAVPVIEGVSRPAVTTGVVQFATSSTGTLLYVPGSVAAGAVERTIALADRAGTVTRLPIPPGPYVHVRASRDGARLAIGTDDGKEAFVSIRIWGERPDARLTFGGRDRFPIWSPDGQRIAFQSDREGDLGISHSARRQRASRAPDDGGAVTRTSRIVVAGRHARVVLLSHKGPTFSLWVVAIADRKATPFGGASHPSRSRRSSRRTADGSAYRSNQSGPDGGLRGPLPRGGREAAGVHRRRRSAPVGRRRPRALLPGPSRLMSVDLNAESGLPVGRPRMLFERAPSESALNSGQWGHTYAVLPDGKRFLFVSNPARPEVRELKVVLNWFEELKRRVP